MTDTDPTANPQLEQALARFKTAVIANGLTEDHFLPPVPADRVQSVFDELDLPLHPDIATLYAWSEGYTRKLGHPDSFLRRWFIMKLDQSIRTREIRAPIFHGVPGEANLWPVVSIDHADICVQVLDGTLWDMPRDDDAFHLDPAVGLTDLFNFWAHLHETGYYELIDGGWHDEYDRGLRDFGTDWHPLQEYA